MPTKKQASLADRLRAELTAALDHIESLTLEGDRLERTAARLAETNRALSILLERAEQDRDAALMRLSTAANEATSWRHQLTQARALLQQLAVERGDVVPPSARENG